MNKMSITAFKIVLVLLGLYGIFLGIDFGWGGFRSLGWQGTTDFFQITDALRYEVQDSNFRFFGGMFIGVGMFLLLAATNLRRYQQSLTLIFGLILIGGLTRFSVGKVESLLMPEIIVALVVALGSSNAVFWHATEVSHCLVVSAGSRNVSGA